MRTRMTSRALSSPSSLQKEPGAELHHDLPFAFAQFDADAHPACAGLIGELLLEPL